MNPDLANQRLQRSFQALTSKSRILRECRYVLNEEGARALEERIALAAARCAARPMLDRERLRASRIAFAVALVSLIAAGVLFAHLMLSSGA